MYKIMTPGPTQVAENVRLARSRECKMCIRDRLYLYKKQSDGLDT